MAKIYYDSASNIEIIDASGLKTLEQIKAEFGDRDYMVFASQDERNGFVIDGTSVKVKAPEDADALQVASLIGKEKVSLLTNQAIQSLKDKGVLDSSGDLIK